MEALPALSKTPSFDEKKNTEVKTSPDASFIDEKAAFKTESIDANQIGDVFQDDPRLIDLGEDGKERPIGEACLTFTFSQVLTLPSLETDADYSLRLISLEDDSSLPIYTFRMWFLGLGLACFGAVLGQIFVRIFRTVSLSHTSPIVTVFPASNCVR
jgi:hypothetical protein